jgi:predicted kinase
MRLPNPALIFSGLPGTGNTTRARMTARQLHLPLLAIDDVEAFIPLAMRTQADPYWKTLIDILLKLAASQLALGLSVVVDSVFMGEDRELAHQIALEHQAAYRPIHTYVSDEKVWQARVTRRLEIWPDDEPATWERIQEQRLFFRPWGPREALFLDALNPANENFEKVIDYLTRSPDQEIQQE